MDQGASVSELMILWAATGEAPLDLSGEHRDPCDHQIISFIGEEDFTELQWRKIWIVFLHYDAQKLNVMKSILGLSVILQFKSLGSVFFFFNTFIQ